MASNITKKVFVFLTFLISWQALTIFTIAGPLDMSEQVTESLDEPFPDDCHEQRTNSNNTLRMDGGAIEKSTKDCKNCAKTKTNLTSNELAALRVEVVKYQILRKLQLTRPPCPKLPKPPLRPLLLAAGMMEDYGSEEQEDENISEIHSASKRIVLYPTEEILQCADLPEYPCSRFRFRLPGESELSLPISAEFWFYKLELDMLLKVTELFFNGDDFNTANKRIVATESERSDTHLNKFKMPSVVPWTDEDETKILDLQVWCYSGCMSAVTSATVSTDPEKKPFLILDLSSGKVSARNRRSVDCVDGSTTCCRESLVVSFADIGWDDWILAPESYEANFCKGKCVSDVSSNRYHHSAVLHRFIQSNPETADDIGLTMCCTPSKLSSLSILYQDDNGTIIKTNLPDMKVEACDCA